MYKLQITILNNNGDELISQQTYGYESLDVMGIDDKIIYNVVESAKTNEYADYGGSSKIDLVNSDEVFKDDTFTNLN